MTIDKFREQLTMQLQTNSGIIDDILNGLNPGIYGSDDTEMSIMHTDIYVDIPNKKFTFKNLNFYSKVRVGASRDEDSILVDFNTTLKGHGSFDYESSKKIIVSEIEIDHTSNTDVF